MFNAEPRRISSQFEEEMFRVKTEFYLFWFFFLVPKFGFQFQRDWFLNLLKTIKVTFGKKTIQNLQSWKFKIPEKF